MDINQQIKSALEVAKTIGTLDHARLTPEQKHAIRDIDCFAFEWLSHQATEIDRLTQEISTYKAWAPNSWNSAQKLEIAIKALEEYTSDSVYCGRCDGISYDKEQGETARKAISEIQEVSK